MALYFIASPTEKWGNNSHLRGVPQEVIRDLLEKANLEVVRWYEFSPETILEAKHR